MAAGPMTVLPNTGGVTEESARLLKQLRTDAGLTQAELAERTGVPESVVRRAEAGAYPRPGWRLKLAAYFDRKPSDIWPVE
jgi:DNA-binding XRE family transcriptional regulator